MGSCPKLRIAGFSDAWEQRKLGDLLEKYEDPVETPHNGYFRLGIRSHAKGTFHSFVEPGKELETAKMHRVASDKFILNITFAWEHAVAITDSNDAGKLVSHRFPQFSFTPRLKPKFFKFLMLDRKFREYLELCSPGGAGRNRVLSVKDMMKYLIKLPSVEEQKKIGAFFENLDNLITLHQRKCDSLKTAKKYFLQNMFPSEGEKFPKLRLSGFTDAWEQRKLESISAEYKYSIVDGPFGSDLKTADYTEEGVLVMQSNYITGGKFEIKQPYFVSIDKAEQLSRCHCKGGDILIAKIGANFGICNIIPENIEDAVLSSNCMKVDLDEKHDNDFYKHYFNLLYDTGYYYSIVGITAQPALSLKLMKNLEVPSPTLEEQRKIAEFFNDLDNLITLHQRKLVLNNTTVFSRVRPKISLPNQHLDSQVHE